MNEYLIQHRICSISHLAMGDGTDPTIAIDGIVCKQEQFTLQTGPTGDFWFAEGKVHTANPQDAYSTFVDKLERIVSIFSLVGQGYIRLMLEPYLITRTDAFPHVGLFRFTMDRDTHGLLLLERHGAAVRKLYADPTIPADFYLYWNDATNTTGYSSKLLLMFAAIEALGRKRDKNKFPKGVDLYKKILGDSLAVEIYEDTTGLRNQLSHGEYFSAPRSSRDYLNEVHKAVISYFNKEVLNAEVIDYEVEQPQRNFFENKSGFTSYIQTLDHSAIPDLKEVLTYFTKKENGKTVSGNGFISIDQPAGF